MESHDLSDLSTMLQNLELGAGPFVIAGRTFRQPESKSIAQDAWIERRYRSSGLTDLARTAGARTETIEELSERLLWEGLESGVIYELLAGMLVEDGTAWTRASAERNAQWFATLTAPADKAIVYDSIGALLFRFLKVAAVSKLISESSSITQTKATDHQHDGDEHDGTANESPTAPIGTPAET